MLGKKLNEKISKELFEKLSGHPVFSSNWKTIGAALHFINHLIYLTSSRPNLYSGTINKIFNAYLPSKERGSYRKYLNALKELGFLTIYEHYIPSVNKKGICKCYYLTDEIIYLLKGETEQLRVLANKPQKKSRRRKTKLIKKDYVLDYLNKIRRDLTFNRFKADCALYKCSQETLDSAEAILKKFKDGNFRNLRYNKVDGRVYNEFVALKSEVRNAFTCRGLERIAVIDIKACHASFLARQILNEFIIKHNLNIDINTINNNYKNNNLVITTTNNNYPISTTTLHMLNLLIEELLKWEACFIYSATDYREILAKELGETKETIKDWLNQLINGNKRYKRLFNLLSAKFPNLFSFWQTTNTKATGPNISKYFESKITLNPEVYKAAEKLGLILAYEYDGFSIFGTKNSRKIHQFVKEIHRICGFVVFKVDILFIESKPLALPKISFIKKLKTNSFKAKSNLEFCLGP